MKTVHAWDCRCGTRNAPSFTRCRNCGEWHASGTPLYADQRPALPPRPAPVVTRAPKPPMSLRRKIALGIGGFLVFSMLCGIRDNQQRAAAFAERAAIARSRGNDLIPCPRCGGRGRIYTAEMAAAKAMGASNQDWYDCPRCYGAGEIEVPLRRD